MEKYSIRHLIQRTKNHRMSKAKPKVFFADTTVAYYLLHAHSLLKQAVQDAVKDGVLSTTNFVRGEYLRGYVVGLIDLYSAIDLEDSVRDGIHVFVDDMGHHPRRVGNALRAATDWLVIQEGSSDVQITLRRLGEYIRSCLILFDHFFRQRHRDPLNCDYGLLSFREETFNKDHLYDFYAEVEKITEGPACSQCDFRQSQLNRLQNGGIDLYSPAQRNTYKDHPGYVQQAVMADKAARSEKKRPSCWYCERMGDTIIALSAPEDSTILTGDAGSFVALGAILNVQVVVIPSLRELRAGRASS